MFFLDPCPLPLDPIHVLRASVVRNFWIFSVFLTIANLVRRAVVAQYLVSDKKERLEALKRLSEVGGATGDWEEIEKQILQEIPILTNNTYLGFFYWALNFFISSVSKGST